MRKTVASREPGARSKEQGAKSKETSEMRNAERRTSNAEVRYAAAVKVTGAPEVCAIAGAAKG
jgi:hypothetical protein